MKVALIGYGYWGKNIARVFAHHADFELVCICDRSEASREKAARLFPNVKVVRNVAEIPKEVQVTAVITPTQSHAKLAIEQMELGRHVLVTKPFAMNRTETDQMFRAARVNNVACFADHTFIFNPAVRRLKEMLPKIGDPYFVVSQRMNLGLYQPDVNVIFDLMPHDLSILCYLFDDVVTSCQKTAFNAAGLPQEDVAHVSMRTENGLRAHCSVSWLSPFKVRQFILVGSQGMLSYDDNAVTEKIKFFDRSVGIEDLVQSNSEKSYTTRISYRTGDLFSPAVPNTEALAFELDEFQRAIEDEATRAHYSELTSNVMRSLDTILSTPNWPENAMPTHPPQDERRPLNPTVQ